MPRRQPPSSNRILKSEILGHIRVVRWGTFRRILFAWLLTPLCCGTAAALIQALAT